MEFGGILHEKIEEEKPGEKGGGDGKVEEAVFELERKNGEIKVKDDTIKDWMEKYQKLDKLKIELKRSLDQREKHVTRLEEKAENRI